MISLGPSIGISKNKNYYRTDVMLKGDDYIFYGALRVRDAYCCVYVDSGYVASTT